MWGSVPAHLSWVRRSSAWSLEHGHQCSAIPTIVNCNRPAVNHLQCCASTKAVYGPLHQAVAGGPYGLQSCMSFPLGLQGTAECQAVSEHSKNEPEPAGLAQGLPGAAGSARQAVCGLAVSQLQEGMVLHHNASQRLCIRARSGSVWGGRRQS